MCPKHPEPSPGSVNAELKSGRSLLNPKLAAFSLFHFHSGDGEDQGSIPVYPLSLTLPNEAETLEENDMNVMVTTIKLKMRSSKTSTTPQHSPTADSMEETVFTPKPCSSAVNCLFAPIRSVGQDEEP